MWGFCGGWPRDPRLDPFREGAWELWKDGVVVGHLISSIGRMRSFPMLWVKQEQMWFGVVWRAGQRDRSCEDYGPDWLVVGALEKGFYEDEIRGGRFDARPVSSPERSRLWHAYKDAL